MTRNFLVIVSIFLFCTLSAFVFPTIEVNDETRVSVLLSELGQPVANHHVQKINPEKVKMGWEIVTKGQTNGPDGSMSNLVSEYFVCTDCHNLVREAPTAIDNNQQSRLEYAMKNDLPYLPGSTFWGISNRTSWFNDDHVKKYGDLVTEANHDLKKSTQLCSKECSSGRNLLDWEMDAMMHYFASIELTVGDLGLTDDEMTIVKSSESEQAVALLRSKYLQYYPAKFKQAIALDKRGLGNVGNVENGKFIYEKSCLHCHKKGGVTKTVFGSEKKQKNQAWLVSYFQKTNTGSIYHVIREGTSPSKKTRMYMPIYSNEKITNSQIEDLAAYLLAESKK